MSRDTKKKVKMSLRHVKVDLIFKIDATFHSSLRPQNKIIKHHIFNWLIINFLSCFILSWLYCIVLHTFQLLHRYIITHLNNYNYIRILHKNYKITFGEDGWEWIKRIEVYNDSLQETTQNFTEGYIIMYSPWNYSGLRRVIRNYTEGYIIMYSPWNYSGLQRVIQNSTALLRDTL